MTLSRNPRQFHHRCDWLESIFSSTNSLQAMGFLESDSFSSSTTISQLPHVPDGQSRNFIDEFQTMTYSIESSLADVQLPLIEVNSLGRSDTLPQERNHDDAQKADISTKALNDITKNTTLCSLAYRLVSQCNRQGLDLHVLHIRMQHGFQQGMTPNEGCRVDNQVLLGILTEIS